MLKMATYTLFPPQPAYGHLLPHGGEGRDEGHLPMNICYSKISSKPVKFQSGISLTFY